jgi:hypothetical protein
MRTIADVKVDERMMELIQFLVQHEADVNKAVVSHSFSSLRLLYLAGLVVSGAGPPWLLLTLIFPIVFSPQPALSRFIPPCPVLLRRHACICVTVRVHPSPSASPSPPLPPPLCCFPMTLTAVPRLPGCGVVVVVVVAVDIGILYLALIPCLDVVDLLERWLHPVDVCHRGRRG